MSYEYSKPNKSKLDLETIDKIIELAVIAPTSKVDMVFKALQLGVVAVGLWCRKSVIEEQMLLDKKAYQEGRVHSGQREVDDLI